VCANNRRDRPQRALQDDQHNADRNQQQEKPLPRDDDAVPRSMLDCSRVGFVVVIVTANCAERVDQLTTPTCRHVILLS
jgi:hypothetical protein